MEVVLCWYAGVVELVADYTVCKEGEAISPEASRILVKFLDKFRALLLLFLLRLMGCLADSHR